MGPQIFSLTLMQCIVLVEVHEGDPASQMCGWERRNLYIPKRSLERPQGTSDHTVRTTPLK